MDSYANPPLIVPDTKLQVVSNADPTCATFIIAEEDHTLGNALRYVLAKHPDVELCGYTIPHPSEAKMHVRLQTRTLPATDVFKEGLKTLQHVCSTVGASYSKALDEFKSKQ